MLKFIEQLQSKSKRTRRRVAFGISGSITFLIFILWFANFVGGTAGEVANVEQDTQQALTPFESIFRDIRNTGGDIRESIEGIQGAFNRYNYEGGEEEARGELTATTSTSTVATTTEEGE